jgi:hypothetical protein
MRSKEKAALQERLSESLEAYQEMERKLQPFIRQRRALVMPSESTWNPGTSAYF